MCNTVKNKTGILVMSSLVHFSMDRQIPRIKLRLLSEVLILLTTQMS